MTGETQCPACKGNAVKHVNGDPHDWSICLVCNGEDYNLDILGFAAAIASVIKPKTRIRRDVWGFDVSVYMVPGSEFTVNRAPLNLFLEDGTEVKHNPHLAIIDNGVVSNWSPTNEDIFATNWEVYVNE